MADFVDDEAEESEEEEEEVDHRSKKKAKMSKAMEDSEEEEDDDEDRIREELKDLIDDNPIEESDGEDSDGQSNSRKRKKSGSVNYDDQLEDDDYELLEENLGITVDRKKRFKRLRRVQDPESDEDDEPGEEREIIANQLFDGGSGDEHERMSVRTQRHEEDTYDEAGSESHYSDADDFIVDNDGNPIAEKRRQKKPVFSDATLQEAQDIFGIDFDYEEFDKYGDAEASQEEDEDDDEYLDDDERPRRRKKAPKQKTKKNTIFDIYEPSELKRGHFTDKDNEIRGTDIPERMQQRSVPITPVPEGSDELDLEAEWIYKQAFCRPTISIQDAHLSEEAKERARKGPQTVPKIKKALDFMRNQNFEVPFISFYRKEYVLPELNINDLWKVYRYDAKWCELRQRKENLVTLFERMRDYQLDEIMKNPDAPLPESMRVIKEEDIDRLKSVETSEELNDVHHHFMLYYSHEIPNMQEIIREKNRYLRQEDKIQKRQQRIYEAIERGEEPPEDDEADAENYGNDEVLKHAVRTGSYAICRKAGLHGLAKKFGLPPEHFAENVRDNYQRHDVEQDPVEPTIAALQYCSPQFNTSSDVLKAVEQMVAIQLAREPVVRKCVREVYMERAKISVRPTKRGIKEIDENHPIYTIKYLKDKPVQELVGDQYLKLFIAERDKLVTISLSDTIEGTTSSNYIDELKQLYHRDEFSKNVQDWNALRASSVEMALTKMIIPDMQKELRANLLAESKEFVLRACCRKMYNWIKVAPYVYKPEEATPAVVTADNGEENWDTDWDNPTPQPPPEVPKENAVELDTSKGLRVMGIAYVPDFTQAAFACLIAPGGECTDHLRLPHLLKRRNSFKEDDKALKEADLLAIRAFISSKKPHVIALGGESRESMMLVEDLKECITILNTDEQYPIIQVEICENELAKIYAQSIKAVVEFKEYPVLLRQAISVARRLQDPLVEFSQLCTSDDEILCLKYHTYQDEVPKEELLENLQLEFVNRVNEVGVDINRALHEGSLSGNLLQFVCGLGARKAQALVKTLKQTNQRIENRTQLVTTCHMGPKVFINCAGFIKIDTSSLGDSTEAYVEVLDGSRVHPETYEWARKMAVDALEYDDEDANPAGALEDIFKCPDRLKDLDLDAFAEELERQGFGNKAVTLYDIRAELNCRYKDLRAPYESPSTEKLFDMLTKETPETFYIGKLITATVSGIVYRKPEGEQLDQANPLRNDETSLWQCPFCMKNDFPELSEVWGHFDAGECRGKAMGVRLRLDNGISGFIHVKNLSDKRVDNPEDRVRPGQIVHCRVIKIEVDRFSIECTSKSSDLADKNNEMKPQRDPYYDTEAEENDIREEEETKKVKQQRAYMKRVIVHPAFHNITYAEAAKQMACMKQGEVIIRPSSKGPNHLTVTWKVVDDILHHIDVREESKKFDFSLGEKLWIGTEEYEDLDEIIARHVNPMAAYAAELLECNYYKPNIEGVEAKAEEQLKERKREKPSSIPCILSPSKTYPGKFLLSYLPRERCQHEYFTVTPDGVRYRGQVFPTIGKLFSWFKKHFREPREVLAPKTPAATPGMYGGPNDALTPHHTLSLTADESPHQFSIGTPSIASAGGFGDPQSCPGTPYTPSGQTPSMTPWQTPGQTPGNETPKWGQKSSNDKFLRPNAPGTGSNYRSNFGGNKSSDWGSGGNKSSDWGSGGNKSSDWGSGGNKTSDWGSGGDRGRGRGRGRGNRGRGTPRGRGNGNRGSYSRHNSFNDSSSSNFDWNAKKTGDSTPLWDESESWGSPPDKAQNKTNSNIPNIPKIGGQTPLWDESESWASPGEAALPNDPRASKANSSCGSLSVPINTSQAPLWDASESWGSPPSESQKSSAPSYQPPNNRSGASNVPKIVAQAPLWDASESWGSPPSESQKSSAPSYQPPNNRSGASNVPKIVAQAPLWDASESWGSPPSESQKSSAPSYQPPNNRSGASNVPKIVAQAPLWDASESWGSPPSESQKSSAPSYQPPNNRSGASNVPKIVAQAPLWDASESWGSPPSESQKSSAPSYQPPNNRSGASNVPKIVAQAPLWDASESWGSPPSESQKSSAPSYQPPNNRSGASNVPKIVAQAPLWDASESWGSPPQTTSQDKLGAPSVPIITTQAPTWDPNESWDTSESNDNNSGAPRFSTNSNRSMGPPTSQPPRRGSYNNSSNYSARGNRNDSSSFSTRGNRNDSSSYSNRGNRNDSSSYSNRGNRNDSSSFSTRGNRNDSSSYSNRGHRNDSSSFSTRGNRNDSSSYSNRGSRYDSRGGYRNDSGRGNRNDSRGGYGNNSQRGSRNDSWNGNKSWNTSGQDDSQNESVSGAPSLSVPIIGTQVPLWDASESWDTDPVVPQAKQANKDANSRENAYQQNKPASVTESPFAPIIPVQAPLWDASESWDTDPVVSQPNRANNDTNSRGKAYQQNKPASVPASPSVPIIPVQVPLWDASESWDTDPVVSQPNRANNDTNSRGKAYQQNKPPSVPASPSVPIIPVQVPLWDASESWDTDPVVPQPNRANNNTNSRGKAYQQNKPASVPASPSVPIIPVQVPLWDASESWDTDPVPAPQINKPKQDSTSQKPENTRKPTSSGAKPSIVSIVPVNLKLWDDSESWDNPDPSTPKQQSTPMKTVPYQSSPSGYSNASSSYSNSSNFTPNNNRGAPWKPRQSWNSQGQGGNPQFGRDSGRNSSFQRGRGNQQNNSGRWNQNNSYNSSGSGNSRGGGGRGRFPPRQSRDMPENNSAASSAPSVGNNAPLWNESESWDTSEPKTIKKEPSAGKNTSSDVPQNNSASLFLPINTNIAPLYDESESWD